jgi:hypothetical protein
VFLLVSGLEEGLVFLLVSGLEEGLVFPLVSGLSGHCFKKQAWLGCVSEARLSTFASPESVWELHQWHKTVTTNWKKG